MPLVASLERAAVHVPNATTAFIGSFVGLGGLVLAEDLLHDYPLLGGNQLMLFIGSFGALAALLYGSPAAPLSRLSNTICKPAAHNPSPLLPLGVTTERSWLASRARSVGHVVSIIIAIAVHHGLGNLVNLPVGVEKVLTPSLAIAAMVALQVTHPPAAASVVYFVTLEDARNQGPIYILFPALAGAVYMLAVQLLLALTLRKIGHSAQRYEIAKNGQEEPSGRGWMWARDLEERGVLTQRGQRTGKGYVAYAEPSPGRITSLADAALMMKQQHEPLSRSSSGIEITQEMPKERLREQAPSATASGGDDDADALDTLRSSHPALSTSELRKELAAQRAGAGALEATAAALRLELRKERASSDSQHELV